MGLLYADARRLVNAKRSGVSFECTLTVSRQQIYLHKAELASLRKMFPAGATLLENYRFGEYADRFWQEMIGVGTLETIDASAYEGASIIHDLNQPVPRELWGRFDAVVEAGSLEHIFNFPTAIANIMKLVKVGGAVFLTTVANNLCGHGFYQFSPELIYRVFSPENGFDATSVVFLEAACPSVELAPIASSYGVIDPRTAGCRVGLQSKRPVMMMVESRKTRETELFQTTPQQSDYVTAWQKSGKAGDSPRSGARNLIRSAFQALPETWKRRVERVRMNRQYSLANRRFYRVLP
jgi:hypothetical protein